MLKYTLFSSANQLWQKFTEINPCWFRIVIITLEIIIQKRHRPTRKYSVHLHPVKLEKTLT